jgi:hypothetical protein
VRGSEMVGMQEFGVDIFILFYFKIFSIVQREIVEYTLARACEDLRGEFSFFRTAREFHHPFLICGGTK